MRNTNLGDAEKEIGKATCDSYSTFARHYASYRDAFSKQLDVFSCKFNQIMQLAQSNIGIFFLFTPTVHTMLPTEIVSLWCGQ